MTKRQIVARQVAALIESLPENVLVTVNFHTCNQAANAIESWGAADIVHRGAAESVSKSAAGITVHAFRLNKTRAA